MRKILNYFFVIAGLFLVVSLIMSFSGVIVAMNPPMAKLSEPSILHLELKNVITSDLEFVDHLVKYRDDENIKGVLIEIDSPGGVVGPSQEIYSEIKKVREKFQKPVIVSCNSLAASGAYYAAVAADKIYVNPGTLMGSIGVIMQFANMEKLYEWAKMDIFSITTGQYKDSGAPYRSMREDEKALFQTMILEVQGQFKKAIKEGRKMRDDVLDEYADGRIFHGEFAVENGFADVVGTFDDARQAIGEMAGLGEDPKLFQPKNQPENLMEWLNQNSKSYFSQSHWVEKVFNSKLVGKPLFLMPGSLGVQ